MAKLNFVTSGDPSIASFRYHVQIPARELNKLGHKAVIAAYPEIEGVDAYVFSKHWNYGDYWYMLGVQSLGGRAVFHCCDDHFATGHEQHYRRMLGMADKIIVPTEVMANTIETNTGRKSTLIPDPYEFDEVEPSFGPNSEKLRLLWFGHHTNLKDVIEVINEPGLKYHDVRLCTNYVQPWPKELEGCRVLPYSEKSILDALNWCDAVILPTGNRERKLGRSHNRLVEAVRRGKFVIASELPAYAEYGMWMYVGDVVRGVEWVQNQKPSELTWRIREAQKYIETHYNPGRIGKLWETALLN